MKSTSCDQNAGVCMGDPRCLDLNCPGHPALSCAVCQGKCDTPQACQLPEPRLTFRPTYDIEGPELPRTRAGWGRALLVAIGIAGAFLVLGVVGRLTGAF